VSGRADVSVIVCCYNPQPSLLARAVASIAAQTLLPSELILVDDGSRVPVEAPAGDLPFDVRVHRLPSNQGQASALNAGVAEAKCSLVCFLDCDDEWMPPKLERQVALWQERDGSICLAATAISTYDAEADRLLPPKGLSGGVSLLSYLDVLEKRHFTGWSTLMLPRRVYAAARGCDTTLMRCQDWDFWLRAVATLRLPVAVIEEPLVRFRYEPRSYAAADYMLKVFEKWRRASATGSAPAVPLDVLGRLRQRHLINYAYRATMAGRRDDARRALSECAAEPDGSAKLALSARVAALAPGLFAASVAYRKMLRGQMAWRLRARDPRWTG